MVVRSRSNSVSSYTAEVSGDESNKAKRRKVGIQESDKVWQPPSVSSIESPFEFKSSTYHSEIPVEIQSNPNEEVVLGVDEAGRGPVLGPMVYGIAYSLEKYSKDLQNKYGFADSKTLKYEKREELFKMIEDESHEINRNVGWATRTMTAKDISSGMLQSVLGKGSYNLNEQAHDATIQLIKEVISRRVNVKKVFVDTVGPPTTYQAKLKKIFPEIDITVSKKADSIYPIVSTASVVAKVTRDMNLNFFGNNITLLKGHNLGSGYPSDPNTSKWLNGNVDPIFGWCFGLIRFSWQTAKDSLERKGGANVIYEEQCLKDNTYKDVSEFFTHNDEQESVCIDTLYYGSDEVSI